MRSLLVHGCYDRSTLTTLQNLGISRLAFDLRGTSPNLIPFSDLQVLLKEVKTPEIVLIFQNDRVATVLSFIDLLKDQPFEVMLEFRDQRELSFYYSLNRPFYWMFHPTGDWKNILLLPNLKGVLLPLEWKSDYQQEPELWELIERQNLEVFLHADTLSEAQKIEDLSGVNLSVDLTGEIEKSFRCVDQERLKKMQLWRRFNENPSV